METIASQRTPLYDIHERLGAKIVDFHGWLMPIHYTSIVEEHKAVRNAAGIFDVSHMGEILVYGGMATAFVNMLVTNDISKASDQQCVYSPMCRPDATIIDDLIVYKHNRTHYMLVVNASNIRKDLHWIMEAKKKFIEDAKKYMHEFGENDLVVRDVSDKTAMISVQGPKAAEILQTLTSHDLSQIKKFRFDEDVYVDDIKLLASRTGYTGEDGFELYVPSDYSHEIWEKIMVAGKDKGLLPVGLGARDTLRLEAALMLYGNDIDDTTTPFEAPLSWTVKMDKKDFNGKQALEKQMVEGVKKKLIGLELTEKGIPRQGYMVSVGGKESGIVTSGTHSPTLQKGIALAYVKPEHSGAGTEIDVIIRDKPVKAKVVQLPFYRKK